MGCDIMSDFKRGKADLNTEFSFFYIDYFTKAEEPRLLKYIPTLRSEEMDYVLPYLFIYFFV